MRFILGWTFKLAFLGVIYLGITGGPQVKLPETVLGYKVPKGAQQFIDRNEIAAYGQQTQSAFKSIEAGLK
jgi:hypothetical protein